VDVEFLYLLSDSLRRRGCKDEIELHLPEEQYESICETLKHYNIEKLTDNSIIYHGPHGKIKIIKIGENVKTDKEIDKEYSDLCAQLGDIEIKKGALDFQKNEVIKKISQVIKEKVSNQNKEQEQ
jgi:hypothetical protein